MSVSPVGIEASYAECRRVVRRAGSNFPAGFILLPRAQRRAMDALYAFMRHSDDLVDQAGADHSSREALVRWRADLENALRCVKGDSPIFVDTKIGTVPESTDAAPAAAAGRGRHGGPIPHPAGIPPRGARRPGNGPCPVALPDIRGLDRLLRAGGLGRRPGMHSHLGISRPGGPGAGPPGGHRHATDQHPPRLGRRRPGGPRLSPLDDLRQCGYEIEQLEQGVTGPAFRRLMELEIGRAEEFYRGGAALLDLLEPAGRRIFGLMMATYHALLAKIARRPEDVFRRRIRLSRSRKLLLAARWALLYRRPADVLL